MLRNRFRFIVLLFALLIPTAIVFAAETVTLGNFQIDLVSHETNQDGTDTFTYAVTAINPTQALSHWTLGIETCVDYLVSPLDGPYTTATDIASCTDGSYVCQEANYTVVTGNDQTLSIFGIKFEDGDPQLVDGNTHVFQITVEELAYIEPVTVGVKYGSSQPMAKIDGPVCGSGTAVSLASTSVGSTVTVMLLPLLLTAVVLMAITALFIWRRELAPLRNK